MFDFIRNNQKLMQFLLLVLIVPSFAFFGLEGYSRFMDSPQDLVSVNGKPITQPELDGVMREQLDRLKQMLGGSVDTRQFDTPEARQSVLDDLIRQRVLNGEVEKLRLTVSEAKLQETIMAIPEVAALRKPDGAFDLDTYKQLLAAQGMTPEQFDARVRFDMATKQIPEAVSTSAWLPKTVTDRLIAIRSEEREVQERMFAPTDFSASVKPTPEQLKVYFDANQKAYEVPEQARVEYLQLSNEAVAASVKPSEDDIRKYYEQNQERYRVEEQRRASHILITADKGAKAEVKAAAREKAQKLLAEVRANPASFADVARKESQDPGSAATGGDLDYFGRGAMVKPFEDAVFGLKRDGISDVVETDFGYHIIKLTDIRPGEARPLVAVREEIEADLKRSEAARKFGELVDSFSNLVYEQADSLKPAADKLKLEIQSVDGVTRTPAPQLGATHPLNNEKLLKSLFSADSVKNRRNTEAVEVAPGVMVAARIVEHRPAAVRKFEDVQEQVRAQFIIAESTKLARAEGERVLEALRKGGADDTGFGNARPVSRMNPQGMAQKALEAVMKADVSKLPAVVGVESGNGYALYRITRVQQSQNMDAGRRAMEARQLVQVAADADFTAYIEALRAHAKVKVIRPLQGESKE